MKHYVCKGGCGNVSNYAGVCDSEGCKDEGKPLLECTCEDEQHINAGSPAEGEESSDEPETY